MHEMISTYLDAATEAPTQMKIKTTIFCTDERIHEGFKKIEGGWQKTMEMNSPAISCSIAGRASFLLASL